MSDGAKMTCQFNDDREVVHIDSRSFGEHFTPRPLVKWTKDSTLEANGQRARPSKMPKFWCQEFIRWKKVSLQYLWKSKLSLSGQTFNSKLI
jgi:hypothetical protein